VIIFSQKVTTYDRKVTTYDVKVTTYDLLQSAALKGLCGSYLSVFTVDCRIFVLAEYSAIHFCQIFVIGQNKENRFRWIAILPHVNISSVSASSRSEGALRQL
jgi:hypothetical protein